MLPRLAIALFALFFNYQASADELLMKNGSLLVGTLVSASDSTVVFDTPFAGEITLKQENIERITTTESVTLLMDDERVYRDKRITEQDGELTDG
jgi:pSer/pThr/pTyr-binding forkhead associated (FHA) protein